MAIDFAKALAELKREREDPEYAEQVRLERSKRYKEIEMANENKKYPLTVFGLYTTSGANSRSAKLTQEAADKACAAIQAAVGGKIAVRQNSEETKAKIRATYKANGRVTSDGREIDPPDYFLEAVTPDLLAEERARMAQNNPRDAVQAAARRGSGFQTGDDSL